MKLRWHPSRSRRVLSCVLAAVFLCLTPMSAMARTTEEVEAEQAELEQERQQLQDKLESLREDEAKKQEYQQTLQEQIDVLEEQISSARRDIDELNANITQLDMKLAASQNEVADTIAQFKQRVSAIYRAGSVSTLEVLLNSNSFSDFSMRSELLSNMSRHDQEMIDKLEAYMESTREERQEREKQKAVVADLKKGMEQKQTELSGLYEENAAAIAELQGAQGETTNALKRNEEEMAAKDKEIQELIAEQKKREEEERKRQEEAAANNNNGGGGGGNTSVEWTPNTSGGVEGFRPCWPMPGVTYISDEFMTIASGGYRNHGGMDIAGPYYTPIVAAESGTVIDVNTSGWGSGWGHYVLIYHNGTYSTRYAHMSDVVVSNGQYVEQGKVIGYEGSTGDSTGPHLHFEVYQDGVRVNPRNFLF